MRGIFLIWLLNILLIGSVYGQNLVSPCPRLFAYDDIGQNSWYGNITLRITAQMQGIWLRIVLDKPPTTIESVFGDVARRNPTEYLIRKVFQVNAGSVHNIRFLTTFDKPDDPPRLVNFRLNGKILCQSEEVITTSTTPQTITASEFLSPCPDLFKYDNTEQNNKWDGDLKLVTDVEVNRAVVNIFFDRPVDQLSNWFEEATTTDHKEYMIQLENALSPKKSFTLSIQVTYKENEPIPKLIGFSLNNRQVCGKGRTSDLKPSVEGSFGKRVLPHKGIEDAIDAQICGRRALVKTLITYGVVAGQDEWPWHAAIFGRSASLTEKTYLCGGTLINRNTILTAAHCTTVGEKTIDAKLRVVYLGIYYIEINQNKDFQMFEISKITVHPQFNSISLKNDISLMTLDRSVDYNEHVIPVCLWSESVAESLVVDKIGVVVGWGFNENQTSTSMLNKASMPIIDSAKCIRSRPLFYGTFTNENTLCAGYTNGTTVCSGDSGGGLVLQTDSRPGVWQLRAIVSLGIPSETVGKKCDLSHYVIFTDIAKYLNWIQDTVA